MKKRVALLDLLGNLKDRIFIGGPFTWMTSHYGGIKECLEQVFVTRCWINLYLFSSVSVQHLKPSKFDHVPIFLEDRNSSLPSIRVRKQFLFEQMWTSHDNCEGIVP